LVVLIPGCIFLFVGASILSKYGTKGTITGFAYLTLGLGAVLLLIAVIPLLSGISQDFLTLLNSLLAFFPLLLDGVILMAAGIKLLGVQV